MKNKNGISLIVLIITIIVIIILAGAVILSLADNNPIGTANEAVFKQTAQEYNSALALYLASQYSNAVPAGSYNPNTQANFNATTIATVIPDIKEADKAKYEVQAGKLVYVGGVAAEITMLASIGITSGTPTPSGLGVNVFATNNVTVNGEAAAYNNPIIPKGFKAVNTTTTWPADWNSGLVIEDISGNQFVWVPVDGTNVPYAKFGEEYFSYTLTTDNTLPTDVINEQYQITKYGGFYIARYEAGKESTNILVSKKGATVWTDITFLDAREKAVSMHNTPEVKSGIITGTQWDTTTKWIENSGISITDSTSWGNHYDSTSPANVSGFGLKQVTGYSENWKAKNIYDLSGNTWEWTNEIYSIFFSYRGGGFNIPGNGSGASVTYRFGGTDTESRGDTSFRVVLYIQ